MSEIKCVLFDIGGVLVDWRMTWIISEVSKRFEIPEDVLSTSFSKHLHELDSGKINEKMFWGKIAEDVNSERLHQNSESLWKTYFRKKAKPNSNLIKITKNMRRSYTLGIISNIEEITHKIVDDWNILDSFEHKFMSYQIGFSKPDPRIFRHVIEILPFEPKEMVFIDDKKQNVEAASNLGMQGLEYTDLETLKNAFNSIGLEI